MNEKTRVPVAGQPDLVLAGGDGSGTAEYLAKHSSPENYGMTKEEFDLMIAAIQVEEDFIKSQED